MRSKPISVVLRFLSGLFFLGLIGCASAPSNVTPVPTVPVLAPQPTYQLDSKATIAPAPSTATPDPSSHYVNAFGITLPPDAAPPNEQVAYFITEERRAINFAVTVYSRNGFTDMLATPLLRVDKNFDLLPAGAERWEVSPDGLTWTFHLDPKLKWSDGNPLTADDYVFTFQYQADPKHAWDFAWYWANLKNWNKALAGEVPLSDIGVKKVDAYTLQFITETPAPYLPAQAIYARPLSKVAFEKYGEYYNNKPETSVSSSPWILQEWTKGKQIVFAPNKTYTGKIKPYIERWVILFGDPGTDFRLYEANEVDMAFSLPISDLEYIWHDPKLSQEYHSSYGDFRTYYMGFDTYHSPFDNLKVRQAFAKAIDRDLTIKTLVKQGIPAYSFLMPGFPDSSAQARKNDYVNQYDPKEAQKLLAEAGYPGGKNFPKIELWLQQFGSPNVELGNAIVQELHDNLGVPVEVSNKDQKTFVEKLNAHAIPFYMTSYGMDYLDASNMLGIWKSSGRHPWKNDQFDQLVAQASSLTGDPAKRSQMFQDAEKILVDDVGGIFLYHLTPGIMIKPYLKGTELEPDRVGVAGDHWPGIEEIGMLALTMYVSKNVDQYRK